MHKKFLLVFLVIATISFANTNSHCLGIHLKLKHELSLTKKNDSLKKRITEIENYKSIDIVEKVNDFYDSAWNKLISVLSAAGAITLFLIPYLITKNQQIKLNLKTKEFEEMVNAKMTDMESKISQYHSTQFDLLKTEIGSTQSDLSKNLNNEIENVKSFIFILRGMLSEKDNNYNAFFKFYMIAISKQLRLNKTNDVDTLTKAIIERIDHCVTEKISITNYTKDKFEKLVVNLEENYPDELSNTINTFKEKIKDLTIL